MSKIAKGIRAKRFKVRDNIEVELHLETELGERATLKLRNSSLTGVGGWISNEEAAKLSVEIGVIIPESKISWNENEVSLGRLVLRSRRPDGDGVHLGFSCVDAKVPLLGSFSKCFEALSGGEETALDFELSAKKFNLATFMETDHTHGDLLQKCHEYALLKEDYEKSPFWQFYGVRREVSGLRVKLSLPRVRKPTDYISFASYDYFGFSFDPEVKDATKAAIDRYGVSATASPPLSGRTSLHEELENKLANLLRKEDAILFSSGFAANVGALTAILGANDFAVADISSHASIHDGLSASKAKVRLFRHGSNRHLNNLLEEHRPAHAGSLVLSEGLFSMDGTIPDLQGLVKVARKYETRIFLDEAHSFGVLGPTGMGAAEKHNVLDDIDIYTGSLSKGCGTGGGFAAGSRELITWLRAFARAGTFSSAMSAGYAGGSLKSLEILQTRPERRRKLQENIKQFLDGLRALGYEPTSDTESPIIPVIVGDEQKLGKMNQVFLEHGIFVNTIVFPAVPVTSCRFRFSISAAHSASDIQLALMALKRAIEVAGIDFSEIKEAA
jgi:7-keto-8-aminopelargonate synthetase-like enzyme